MVTSQRTKIALIILGIVSAGALAYLIWLFLAPPESIPLSPATLSTEVKTDVITNAGFAGLRPYAELPIEPMNVGRPDPFAPFPIANTNAQ